MQKYVFFASHITTCSTKQATQPIGWAASPALSCQQSYTLTTVRSWRIATTSWRRLAPLAKYTVSAGYGAPAAGSSIPKGHSSRSAVAALEVSLRKNSLCDFWLKHAQAVSNPQLNDRFWLPLEPESHQTRLRCHTAHHTGFCTWSLIFFRHVVFIQFRIQKDLISSHFIGDEFKKSYIWQ